MAAKKRKGAKSAWEKVEQEARSGRPRQNSGRAIYTADEVRAIRRAYQERTLSIYRMAEIFGGKACTIWKAAVGRTYKHVE